MKIPRIMSTQHPDNVAIPKFAHSDVMGGDDEVEEAFRAFSILGADEQLWDAEGKEVDNFVVKKLLSRYPEYFKNRTLGRDKFLTLRVPNPATDSKEGKILLEALHSIPRHFDIGNTFYRNDTAPIFEVVLPMCSNEKNLIRIHEYYKQFIIGNQTKKITKGDISVKEWLGQLRPNDIRVTPLFETKDAIMNADVYTKKYIEHAKIKEGQRVWFARSDPALNYGSTAAVLVGKVGLQKLHALQEKLSLPIYPILGCGSAPFRGNFTPKTAHDMMNGYPSMQTFTAQSAFKYDHPERSVKEAIAEVNHARRRKPLQVDEEFVSKILPEMEADYKSSIKLVADTINVMSGYVPKRRKRKLHIGLFGYSRENDGIQLPRAIKFCASLYSLGLPPDVFGLSTLHEVDLDKMRESYRTFDKDMADALQYLNVDNLRYFPPKIVERVLKVAKMFSYSVNEEHRKATSAVMAALRKRKTSVLPKRILKSAKIRKFLG